MDRKDGALLAHAPLNLPIQPPDPREFMRYTRHPYKLQAMREMFCIDDPWKPGCYGSSQYTKLLCLPGRCYVRMSPFECPIALIWRIDVQGPNGRPACVSCEKDVLMLGRPVIHSFSSTR